MFLLISLLLSYASAQSPYLANYGKDDRLDLYEVSSVKIQEASQAVAALIYAPKLTAEGQRFRIDLQSYEKRFGMCSDVRFAQQPSAPFATGFLVGPRHIMTAAHAVINNANEKFVDELLCSQVQVLFGYALASAKTDLSVMNKKQIYSCKKVVHRKIRWMREDYSLIELDREVLSIQPLQFESIENIAVGTPILTIGHPHGLPMKFSANAQIRELQGERFSMNTDTSSGNSGSPIFDARSMKVLGIHVSGELDFKKTRGCKEPYQCEVDGCWGSWGYRPPQSFLDSLPQYFSKN